MQRRNWQRLEPPPIGEGGKSAPETKKAATDGGQESPQPISNSNDNETVNGGEVVVTGDEFGEYKDIKELRAKAKKYYKEHLQGTSVTNPVLGQVNLDDYDVEFTRAGLGKMAATSAKEHKLLLVPHLPELIRTATKITRNDNVKNKRDASQYAYLHTEAVIDGQKQPVVITIFTDVNGNKYYNHILPGEEKGTKNKDSSVPPAQVTQESDGIPAIDESSVNPSVPQEQQEVTQKTTPHGKNIPAKTGKTVTVVTDSGKEIQVTYKLVPSNSVITSHDPDNIDHAEEFGFDASEVQEIINSTTGGSRMGAGEQAKADAKKIRIEEGSEQSSLYACVGPGYCFPCL